MNLSQTSDGPIQALIQSFSEPQRIPATDAERTFLLSGQRVEHNYLKDSLVSWTYGHGPRIVLVHGWNSRGSHLRGFVSPLVAAGFSVTFFDSPAHGESPGDTSSVVHIGRALLALCQQLGEIHAVIGHSAGSAAALLALQQGLRVCASVHLSGPSSLRPMLLGMARGASLDSECTQRFLNWVPTFIGQSIDSMGLKILKDGLHHPGLIFHDPADRVVPIRASEALHGAWPDSELVHLEGLGHNRPLSDAGVIKRCTTFLSATLPTLAEPNEQIQ